MQSRQFFAFLSRVHHQRGHLKPHVQALPWYTLVRDKVTDPAYASWFMHFGPPTVGQGWHVPQCDTNYQPPLCTDLYHGKRRELLKWRDTGTDSTPSALLYRPGTDPRKQMTCSHAILPRFPPESYRQGYPTGDGNCAAPACDVGSVPVGESRRGEQQAHRCAISAPYIQGSTSLTSGP